MNFLHEFFYTLKILKKNYLFTLLCASVLAVGVGIVVPLYVLVENLATKTPEFPDGTRFISLRRGEDNLSKYDAFHYHYFSENSTVFSELNAWTMANYTISDGDYAEAFKSAAVEPALLQMPQVQPLLGRMLEDSDAADDASPVALISEDLWQSYYAGREDILGHQSRINGEARTIIGVMPAGFRFPFAQDLWIPLHVPAGAEAGGQQELLIVGKLKPGMDMARASEEVALLQQSLFASWPDQYREVTRTSVVPYIKLLDNLRVPAMALQIVFGSLLLLVAFNAGNLFLARGEERLSELSIRSAIGAGTGRLALTLLLESLVVCCLGLVLGWVVAYFGIKWLDGIYVSQGTVNNTRYDQLFWWDMSLTGDLMARSAAGVLLIWLISGGLPAWRLGHKNLSEWLSSASKGTDDRGVTRLSKLLVNLQLIIGCILLTLSATQALVAFSSVPTTTEDSTQIQLGTVAFNGTRLQTQPEQQQYLEDLQFLLAGKQGVDQVVLASAAPGGGGSRPFYNLEDQDLRANSSYPRLWMVTVSSGYFGFYGYQLLEGRNFSVTDDTSSEPVIIIDQRLARRHWPNASAIGKRIQINPQLDDTWHTIIGVSTPGVQEGSMEVGRVSSPVIYRSASQFLPDTMKIMVKVNAPRLSPTSLFREAANQVNRDIPVSDVGTLRDAEIREVEATEISRNAYAAFIFISLYVTGIATYGLAARIAGRRRVETGIRMAVGASRGAAMQVFIKDGFRIVLIGLTVGILLAIALSFLILQASNSAGTFTLLIPSALAIAVVLGVLVMLANYLPARKLVVMEPAEALRHE